MSAWIKSGLVTSLTTLAMSGCGSEEKAPQNQVMITTFEVKKAAIDRCQKEIKKVTGTNAFAPTSSTQAGAQSVTLTWDNGVSAVCVYQIHKGLTSLTIDGKSIIAKQ